LNKMRGPLWDSARTWRGKPLPIFVAPIGAGLSIFSPGQAKQITDTNMVLSQRLPGGHRFTVDEIRIEPVLGSTLEDLKRVTVELFIGNKRYCSVPATQAACRFTLAEIGAGFLDFGHKIPELHILSSESFYAEMTASGDEPVAARVMLLGMMYWPVS